MMMALDLILFQATLAGSLSILLVLTTRRWVLLHFGANYLYWLWWAPILALLLSPFSLIHLTDHLPGFAALTSWTVFANQPTAARASTLPVLLVVWLIPGAIWFAIDLLHHRRWLKQALSDAVAPDAATTRCWQLLLQQQPATHASTILLTEHVSGPVATGLWRQRVLLPLDFQSRHCPAQMTLVLRHEQIHLQRHDCLVGLVAHGLRCLFWFNPLAHIAYHRLRADQELSCDALALQGRTRAELRSYADALLNTATARNPIGAMALTQSRNRIEERINMLGHPSNPPRIIAGITMAVLFGASAVIGAAVAGGPEPSANKLHADLESVVPIYREQPRYPQRAAQEGIEGFVTLQFAIMPDGLVGDIQVIESRPAQVFDQVAIAAIQKWRFEERAQARNATQTLEFKLDKPGDSTEL